MELKAIHYGQVEIVPNIFCDAYILNNQEAVMSERGTADLLGMDHKALQRVGTRWPPKSLRSFCNIELSVGTKKVYVDTIKSPHRGQIRVYDVTAIQNLVCSYALAFANNKLKPHQHHIGQRCVTLLKCFVYTALDAAIKEACGVPPQIQETAQQHYSALEIMKDAGFISSLSNEIAIKKDISEFLNVPDSTLNSFLRKHRGTIQPIILDIETIRSIGSNANRMHGFKMDDVTKIVFGMDTDVSIQLRRRIFGEVGTFSKAHAKSEIEWHEFLTKIFAGFTLRHNFSFGKYKLDFVIEELSLALECNGFAHKYYNQEAEERRAKVITREYGLIRFHHKVKIEVLVNAILRIKPKEMIVLYDEEHIHS